MLEGVGRRTGALLLVLVALSPIACSRNEGRFTLVNGSSDRIAARVEVCGQVSEFDDVGPGETRQGSYRVRGDSAYDVSVTFASGGKANREVGYVTNGFDFTDVITVTTSSIEITGGIAPRSR
ncbi:hypothetical protein FDZ71_00350 [bacterium]|nr:MAG: hypothetical protein FDZ71_00350 [bacterium]